MKLPFGLGQITSADEAPKRATDPLAPTPETAELAARPAVTGPAGADSSAASTSPASAASAAARSAAAPALAARASHDLVAAAAAEENAAVDEGRGRRPAAVGLLWTDALGRTALRSLQILLIGVLAAALIFLLTQVSIVVIPVLLALIVASATWPLIRALTSRRWPPMLATFAVLGGVLLLLGGAIALVVVLVRGQWDSLAQHASEGVQSLTAWVSSTFGIAIDGPQIDAWIEQVKAMVFTKEAGGAAASGLGAGFSTAANLATSAVLFVVVLFFFMKDGPSIWRFALGGATGARRARLELMGRRAVAVMGGYVRGTVIVALVDAVFIGIGLWIVGVPLAFPLAVVVFICAFIPVVGAALAGAIAALVTLVTNGPTAAIIVVGIVLLVNQLEGNLLSPLVLGRSLKLHELVVLLALTVGTVLGGIIGTLLSVPIAAVAWALVKAWNEPLGELALETEQEERTGA